MASQNGSLVALGTRGALRLLSNGKDYQFPTIYKEENALIEPHFILNDQYLLIRVDHYGESKILLANIAKRNIEKSFKFDCPDMIRHTIKANGETWIYATPKKLTFNQISINIQNEEEHSNQSRKENSKQQFPNQIRVKNFKENANH